MFLGVFTYFANWILHNPMCTAMFRCGCVLPPPLGVGWQHCNVHNLTGPRCPWCMAPSASAWTTQWLPSLALFGTAAYLSSAQKQRGKRGQHAGTLLPPAKQVVARTAFGAVAGLLPWVLVSIIVGLAFKVHAHYPYFFLK